MQAGSGEYFAMLNNDVVAEPSWVRVMVEAAETDRSIGMVAPVIKDGNIPGVFDSYGLGLALDGMSRQRWNGLVVPVDLVPESPLLVSGCACLFRADAVRELGYLDEDFFGYCEDSDLGLRLIWAGFRAVAVPGTSVTHFYSQTLGKFNPKKVFWIERNHFWITIKSFPLPLLLFVPWFTFYRYLLQVYVILFGIGELSGYVSGGNGRSSIVKVILQAYLSFLQGLPLMLRKRRQIMRSARRGPWEMTRLIWQNRLPMLEILTGAAKLPRR
jgi:GT2 family glycosyltransferase